MMELLQRLQRAVPQVESWIDDLRVRHGPRAVKASDIASPRLAATVPATILGSARSVSTDAIPFPPVAAYGLPELQAMADMPMAGITFRDMYFVHPSYATEGVHLHELIHIIQWRTLGVGPFLLTYALGIVQHGYAQSPLEAIAFDYQSRFERGVVLDGIVDDVARRAVQDRQDAAVVYRAHGLEMGA